MILYLLGIAGALCTLVGIVWGLLALGRLWHTRWPDGVLFPALRAIRQRLKGLFVHRSAVVHAPTATLRFEALAPTVTVIEEPLRTQEERITALEHTVRELEAKLSDQIVRSAAATHERVAGVEARTDEKFRDADARAQEDARAALRWPALLTALGAMLQLLAVVLDLPR